jgi:hypothetical protein
LDEVQVKENGEWKYVFCRNPQDRATGVVTTMNKSYAQRGEKALEYFRGKCANSEFRLAPQNR